MTVAETPDVKVGDLVRVGRGRKLWRVASFWGTPEHPMADLTPTDGYSRSSALLDRLTVLERAPEASPVSEPKGLHHPHCNPGCWGFTHHLGSDDEQHLHHADQREVCEACADPAPEETHECHKCAGCGQSEA